MQSVVCQPRLVFATFRQRGEQIDKDRPAVLRHLTHGIGIGGHIIVPFRQIRRM